MKVGLFAALTASVYGEWVPTPGNAHRVPTPNFNGGNSGWNGGGNSMYNNGNNGWNGGNSGNNNGWNGVHGTNGGNKWGQPKQTNSGQWVPTPKPVEPFRGGYFFDDSEHGEGYGPYIVTRMNGADKKDTVVVSGADGDHRVYYAMGRMDQYDEQSFTVDFEPVSRLKGRDEGWNAKKPVSSPGWNGKQGVGNPHKRRGRWSSETGKITWQDGRTWSPMDHRVCRPKSDQGWQKAPAVVQRESQGWRSVPQLDRSPYESTSFRVENHYGHIALGMGIVGIAAVGYAAYSRRKTVYEPLQQV